MKLFLLGAIVGGLIGLAVTDFSEAMQGVEAPVPTYDDTRVGERLKFKEMSQEERERSTCYALVPRHETYSVVLPDGVTCISVLQASSKRGLHE